MFVLAHGEQLADADEGVKQAERFSESLRKRQAEGEARRGGTKKPRGLAAAWLLREGGAYCTPISFSRLSALSTCFMFHSM